MTYNTIELSSIKAHETGKIFSGQCAFKRLILNDLSVFI